MPSDTVRRVARLVPTPARAVVKDAYNRLRAIGAHRAWRHAAPAAGGLAETELEILARRYPIEEDNYFYDPEAVRARGKARAEELLPLIAPGASCVEIGSADGMTACAIQETGHNAVAIDIDTSRTDPRARSAGVDVRQMDATRIGFPDETFDLVYSYNAFEHIPDPTLTFAEITRILRPGGMFFLSFTGLRWSPHGAHMYKVLGIPYVTVLFDRSTIDGYLRSRGQTTDFPWVNEFGIEQFRRVFQSQPRMKTVRYTEARNRFHTSLIAEYPAQFRRAPSFDSLLVDRVEALFQKQQR
jgi:SAM-dependent methyltransferase